MASFKVLFLVAVACFCVQIAFGATFEQDAVAEHNKYRALHKAPNLTIDPAITLVAQDWANNLLNSGKFEHRPNNKYGENLYMKTSTGTVTMTAAQCVKAWYDEIKDYDFNNPGFNIKTGHFTQVVWKSTTKVGCAVAQTAKRAVCVCNYNPPGNFLGRFPENVLKN